MEAELDEREVADLEELITYEELISAPPPDDEYYDALAEARLESNRRRARLARTAHGLLARHGLPVHWKVLVRMVRDDERFRTVSDEEVLGVLRSDARFERVREGVYSAR